MYIYIYSRILIYIAEYRSTPNYEGPGATQKPQDEVQSTEVFCQLHYPNNRAATK